MALTVDTPPTALPVSVNDVKRHLRISHNEDDGYLEVLIGAARNVTEAMLNRTLITTTWQWSADSFPSSRTICLQMAPLNSVTSVDYTDEDEAVQTLSSSLYKVDTESEPGRIVLNEGETWPTLASVPNAVQIVYVAGEGATSDSIEDAIKLGIKMLIGTWYANRETIAVQPGIQVAEIPQSLEWLLLPWKVYQ